MSYRHCTEGLCTMVIDDTARQSIIMVDNGTVNNIWVPIELEPTNHAPSTPPTPRDYDDIVVALEDTVTGLTFTGLIENDIIKLTISAFCTAAEDDDVKVRFAVYAVGDGLTEGTSDSTTPAVSDVVTKGTLKIVAGPLSTGATGTIGATGDTGE